MSQGHCPPTVRDRLAKGSITGHGSGCWSQVCLWVYRTGALCSGGLGKERTVPKRWKLRFFWPLEFWNSFIHSPIHPDQGHRKPHAPESHCQLTHLRLLPFSPAPSILLYLIFNHKEGIWQAYGFHSKSDFSQNISIPQKKKSDFCICLTISITTNTIKEKKNWKKSRNRRTQNLHSGCHLDIFQLCDLKQVGQPL